MSESPRGQKYYFRQTKSTGISESIVFVQPDSSPALEVLFSSNEMLGDAKSTLFVVSESARHQKYYFHRTKSIGVRGSTVFVEPESSPATEVLFSSSEMLGDARSTQIVLLLSTKRLLFFARQNKYFLRFADSRRGVFDDPMELLRRARIRFRSTKQVLLAREQFIKHVWNCTRNGFGARKPPAERLQILSSALLADIWRHVTLSCFAGQHLATRGALVLCWPTFGDT